MVENLQLFPKAIILNTMTSKGNDKKRKNAFPLGSQYKLSWKNYSEYFYRLYKLTTFLLNFFLSFYKYFSDNSNKNKDFINHIATNK